MVTVSPPRVTPEDLLAITDRPMPELIDGELVEREMGQRSDSIALNLGAEVRIFVKERRHGFCNGAQGSYQIFPDDPNKIRIPDFSFTRRERLPDGPAEGHGRVAPDLAVEVISPNDRYSDVEVKIHDFLDAGVTLVWVIDPESRSVRVCRPNHADTLLFPGDQLDGEDVLPGFRCDVASLFAD